MMGEVKKDCFGYQVLTGKCSVMNELECSRGACAFFKTRAQFEADREKYPMKKKEVRK